jgi:hypothetical protein
LTENYTQPSTRICRACEVEKPISDFYIDRRNGGKSKFRPDCISCDIAAAKLYGKLHREERNAYRRNAPRGRYNAYKNDAKHSCIEFVLSFEEFMTLWQKSCTYCGSSIKTIGVDRIDSDGKYELSNVTSCCGTCNFMKKAMTTSEFLGHCQKITNYNARQIAN